MRLREITQGVLIGNLAILSILIFFGISDGLGYVSVFVYVAILIFNINEDNRRIGEVEEVMEAIVEEYREKKRKK